MRILNVFGACLTLSWLINMLDNRGVTHLNLPESTPSCNTSFNQQGFDDMTHTRDFCFEDT